MGKTISEEEFRRSPRGSYRTYPWESWTDGQAWLITRGEDYDTTSKNMASTLRNYADRNDLTVEARTAPDEVRFMFRDPVAERLARQTEQLQQTVLATGALAVNYLEYREQRKTEAVERIARWLWRKVQDGVQKADITGMAASRDRKYLSTALDLCLEKNWLIEGIGGVLVVGPQKPPQIIKGELA